MIDTNTVKELGKAGLLNAEGVRYLVTMTEQAEAKLRAEIQHVNKINTDLTDRYESINKEVKEPEVKKDE